MHTKQASRIFALVLALFTVCQTPLGQAQTQEHEYYTIEESQSSPSETSFQPFALSEMATVARSVAVSLLRWTLHSEAPTLPAEKYNRKYHFGRWVNDPNDTTCYNTRAKVLIRDSEVPVSFKQHNHCLVEQGDWADPYAGQEIHHSREVQIDHMVPLKNAYDSGAWEWDFATRCLYANFLGNDFHLISASGRENMRKGDRAPDRYQPPNTAYRCQYLENWLKIKLIWQLKMTAAEVEAIQQGVEDYGCEPKNFALSQRELRQQRKLIHENNEFCPISRSH